MDCLKPHVTPGYAFKQGCRCVRCLDFRRAYREGNRDTQNANARRNRQVRKLDMILYRGGECHSCGLRCDGKNGAIFDFHHPDPTQKNTGTDLRYMRLGEAFTEIEKCYLLCSNCHKMNHFVHWSA